MTAEKPDLKRIWTEAEYLAFVAKSVDKYELWSGRLVPLSERIAVAGGVYEHSTIISNINGAAWGRLRGHRCQVLESNMAVRIPDARGSYLYPDVTFVCEEPRFHNPPDRLQLLNPTAIVEVQSPGTADVDFTTKFRRYLRVESLHEM